MHQRTKRDLQQAEEEGKSRLEEVATLRTKCAALGDDVADLERQFRQMQGHQSAMAAIFEKRKASPRGP